MSFFDRAGNTSRSYRLSDTETPKAKEAPAETAATEPGTEMTVVRPLEFREVSEIADMMMGGMTVVLSTERCAKDVGRRILDFLFGVAYATGGNIKKVGEMTYVISRGGVEIIDSENG